MFDTKFPLGTEPKGNTDGNTTPDGGGGFGSRVLCGSETAGRFTSHRLQRMTVLYPNE